MNSLWIKLIIFPCLAYYWLSTSLDAFHILLLLTIVLSILLIQLLKKTWLKISLFILYTLLSSLYPSAFLALPLLFDKQIHPWIVFFVTLIGAFLLPQNEMLVLLSSALLMYQVLYNEAKIQSNKQQLTQLENNLLIQQRDRRLEHKQLLLSQQQDIEISLLNERNRIARDIHDNVGHLLTSAILQVGALSTISPHPLQATLKETLDKGMNSIRESVHELYEKSEKLENEVKKILNEFPSLDTQLKYQLTTEPKASIKSIFLFVIKESMTNTIKHSSGDTFYLQLDESTHHYYCILSDNGKSISLQTPSGIGLLSLEKRVLSEGGIINFQPELGFRIYISIPKEKL